LKPPQPKNIPYLVQNETAKAQNEGRHAARHSAGTAGNRIAAGHRAA